MLRATQATILCLFAALLATSATPGEAKGEEGILGAEFAVTIGTQIGPFETDAGPFVGGEIGLPIMELAQDTPAHGRLLGLVNIGWSQTEDDVTFEPTVNALAPGALPVQDTVELNTLTIILGLKYKHIYHEIVQPYGLAGFGLNVFLNESDPGSNIGGVAPQPEAPRPEGFPSGQGNVEPGFHLGGGVDFNITKQVFVGGEARYNHVNRDNGGFVVLGGRLGFRF